MKIKIGNLPKIKKNNRIFYNPNSNEKKIYELLSKEIKARYNIQTPSRDKIIKLIISTLTHGDIFNYIVPNFPIYIIRTDIKNFFPSIDKNILSKKIKKANILSESSKKIINEITYNPSVKGVPLGLSFSSLLSELYIESFDREIQDHFKPEHYFRFVDDIIMFVSYHKYINLNKMEILVKLQEIADSSKLKINTSKTDISIFYPIGNQSDRQHLDFDYLGYSFSTEPLSNKKEVSLKVSISPGKKEKFKKRINEYFYLYRISKKDTVDFWKLYYKLMNTFYGVISNDSNGKPMKFGLGYSYKYINDEQSLDSLVSLVKQCIVRSDLIFYQRKLIYQIVGFNDTSLEILKKRYDYTKLTENQFGTIYARIGITDTSNRVSKIFLELYNTSK